MHINLELPFAYNFLLFSPHVPVAQNLQNIIQDQIQSLSSGAVARSSSTSPPVGQTSGSAAGLPAPLPTADASSGLAQHGLTTTAATGAAVGAPSMNSNAQAALMILLTAQMQAQTGKTGETNLLQNPQVQLFSTVSVSVPFQLNSLFFPFRLSTCCRTW